MLETPVSPTPAPVLTVGSLFSGIGGLDLGLERAGMRVVWQSEIDPYASKVLARHWPAVPNLGDITKIDWTQVERPDVICGGYPCQPFSVAGKRKGKADERHLWPFFADALRHLRPRYALLENVPGHLSLGFGDVLGDLSELGYDASWSIVPAKDVAAGHRRNRVVVVAYTNSTGLEGLRFERQLREAQEQRAASWAPVWPAEPDVARVVYGIPDRVDRIRTLGNSVVPQVAEIPGRMIVEHARTANAS